MKKIIIIMLIILLPIILFHKIIFQEGNPIPILYGIIKLEISDSNYIEIGDNKYIAQNNTIDIFIDDKGYNLKDQMGAGYFLNNENLDNFILTKRKFTKNYNIYKISFIDN